MTMVVVESRRINNFVSTFTVTYRVLINKALAADSRTSV